METGKIEYSPDYKSKKPNTRFIFVNEPGAVERAAERARLEREVIEAAKEEGVSFEAFRENTTMDNWHRAQDAADRRRAAVNALLSYEAEQKNA